MVFLHVGKLLGKNAQKEFPKINTYDENGYKVFTEIILCGNIQTVPETLPTPIPTTIPKSFPVPGHESFIKRKGERI